MTDITDTTDMPDMTPSKQILYDSANSNLTQRQSISGHLLTASEVVAYKNGFAKFISKRCGVQQSSAVLSATPSNSTTPGNIAKLLAARDITWRRFDVCFLSFDPIPNQNNV